eukprot:TRINITY_DN1221_c0_g1_i1.p1 TRINITY_DN1221_c0_g1~~TRINITY_DN1221_c0_g1_i1.p1  ORF type:complete len:728 (+),score=189.69 TRINITY_DN1221_c0_g1_i1:64-2184(+)
MSAPATASTEGSVPDELLCMITHKIMDDAVVDPDGNSSSYSKAAKKDHGVKVVATPTTNDATTAQDLQLEVTKSGNKMLCKVIPPNAPKRLPAHIVAVIDVSGSMGSGVSVVNDQGNKESHGLSQLDVVKHSINTIVQCLDDGDHLSIVSYSSTATTVLNAVCMNSKGKTRAKKCLDDLSPGGQTNLWDGLFRGMETIRNNKSPVIRNENIMLFTDGMPNIIPPRGHVPMLRKYIDEFGLVASINTFGFGYSLDSALLHELAVEGMGTYGFIPDSSLVGTVFVNAVSHQLAKCYRDVILNIEESGAKLAARPIQGEYKHTKTTWGVSVRLGDLIYGQPKDVIICFDTSLDEVQIPDEKCLSGINLANGVKRDAASSTETHDMVSLETHNLRTVFVDTVRHAVALGLKGKLAEATNGVEKLSLLIKESSVASMAQVADLKTDANGQVMEGLGLKHFDKWGRHFLPSLMMAHLHQCCNNFKDPGVQHYGGKLFGKLRDKADDIFVSLPPPKPSAPTRCGYGAASGGAARPAQPVKMAKYYNRGGGCVGGSCMVKTAEGFRRADTVKRGDVVVTVEGDAEVLCVVRVKPSGGKIEMVRLEGGLQITPYHPIVKDGQWVFPCNVAEGTMQKAEYVYDFVLSTGHTVEVAGVTCVTLAHEFTEPVVAHPYFGSSRVLKDMQDISSWHDGLITLEPSSFIRDPSGFVTGIAC